MASISHPLRSTSRLRTAASRATTRASPTPRARATTPRRLGQLAGCCRNDHTCGVFVKLSSTLDLGCVAAAGFSDEAGSPASCKPDAGNDSGTFDAHTVPGDAGDASGSDASDAASD